MITLITGTPGSGKTAWTVQELTRLPSQRKIYVHGVPDLKVAHEPIYCLSDLCEHCRSLTTILTDDFGTERFVTLAAPDRDAYLVEQWPDWATEGSLIIVDEVQRVWRPGSKVPDEIAALETHRHKGLDLWLISQGPHLFHANIRLLIGRHIHLVSTWRGRTEYEFPECRQNTTSRTDAVIRPYTLPKKIFTFYKSASLHTKATHRKPLALYFLVATLLIMSVLGFYTYQRFSARFNPDQSAAGGVGAKAVTTPAADFSANMSINQAGFPDFTPTIDGVPESAPAYIGLVKVTSVPLMAGCIVSKKSGCKCYTKQATPYPATDVYCREVIKNHRFNPYLQTVDYANKTPEFESSETTNKAEIQAP